MATDAGRLTTALADRYRIERELGAGGMATVYLADDLRHHRKVAVKVLRPELAAVIGAERFLSEIRTTANLQHPHILPLFDSGQADGVLFYVMPFVAGESLRDLLTREKQLPVHEAVRIATEVGSALDYAHRHDIIHRDVKPENILLHDGQALVSDFGIALAVSNAGSARMTETGLSLGTPHYMSPEQAMGERDITARSDVYALGAVLYEMLTGEPPFTGPTAQAIVARVLTEKPVSIVARRDRVPPHVEDAVLTALEKLPADRFASAAELNSALTGAAPRAYRRGPSSAIADASRHWKRVAFAAAGLAVLATSVAITGWMRTPPAVAERVVRFSVRIPPPGPDVAVRIALSPDGQTLAYADYAAGERGGIYLRHLNRAEATHIPGTAAARTLSFSPDGAALAFAAPSGDGARGELRVVTLAGGSPVTIARNVDWFEGIDWSADGFVYFVSLDSAVVSRVPGAGGVVEHLGTLEHSALSLGYRKHSYPRVTPRRRGVLFSVFRGEGVEGDLGVVDLRTRETRLLLKGSYPVGVRWGHLFFVTDDGTLHAVPFDEDRLEVAGSPLPLVPNLSINEAATQVALAANGTLVYISAAPPESELVWIGMDGTETPLDPSLRFAFDAVAISPDGGRIAFSSQEPDGAGDVWLYDVANRTTTRFTDDDGLSYRPAWSPDGASIVYASSRGSDQRMRSLWIRRADAADTAHMLVRSHRHAQEVSWPRHGPIVFRDGYDDGGTLRDIRYIIPGPDTTSRVFLATRADELNPALSPDGRWLAYMSLESGRDEVYVSPFPGPGARTRVSSGGGSGPVWSRSGQQLFYRAADGSMIAIELNISANLSIARRRVLFSTAPYLESRTHPPYDIGPDGRFLFIKTPTAQGLEVVVNWSAEVLPRLRGDSR